MASLKMTPAQTEKASSPEMPKQEYPYGCCIHLEKEQIAALGLQGAKVGQEVYISGEAFVKSMTKSGSTDGTDYASIDLQITELEVEADQTPLADKMYADAADRSTSGQ
jgi:hypothetical protein